MREITSRDGKRIVLMTRQEIEHLPGYKAYSGGRKARACCPIHNGSNPTALSIDWESGWGSCFSCGDAFALRVDDERDDRRGDRPVSHGRPRQSARMAPSRDDTPKHEAGAMQQHQDDVAAKLAIAISGAMNRLPGSPGERYLADRGISLDVAHEMQLGWGDKGKLAGRVVFPLRDPRGRPTSATGRAANDRTMPKYWTLPTDKGYTKTLVNGGAIAYVRETHHPLVIVEGPMDAAACIAGGIATVVAINGADYPHPEHFAGVTFAIIATDADETGEAARRRIGLMLIAQGVEFVSLPKEAFRGCKDLAEYWLQHHALPEMLIARVTGPHLPGQPSVQAAPRPTIIPPAPQNVSTPAPASLTIGEIERLAADMMVRLPIAPHRLSAEAREDAQWLAHDLIAAGDIHECHDELVANTDMEEEARCASWYGIWMAAEYLRRHHDQLDHVECIHVKAAAA